DHFTHKYNKIKENFMVMEENPVVIEDGQEQILDFPVITAPQGTPEYVDPKYHQCYHLIEKSDVYNFGVVLVKLLSTKLAVDITRKGNEPSLTIMAVNKIKSGALDELVDPHLEIQKNPEVKIMVCAVAELALGCLAND
ncbi:hypothetical protein KI387_001557, partial [Taxus chinensis]